MLGGCIICTALHWSLALLAIGLIERFLVCCFGIEGHIISILVVLITVIVVITDAGVRE